MVGKYLAAIQLVMKKILPAILVLGVIWSGARSFKMNSASGQTSFPGNLAPFTNQITFTNTVVPATNLSALQFADVTTLLLTLQTNIEETLPALTIVTTNPTPINFPAPVQSLGAVPPATSGPPGFFLTPTGAPTGRSTPQPPSFSVQVGSNVVTIDQMTFQALVNLRDQMQQTLPLLQALNGTSPTGTNTGTVTTILLRPIPGITNMISAPITNGFTTPLTNRMRIPLSNFPSPF